VLSPLPPDEDAGIGPVEFEVVEAQPDQLRDAEPRRETEIEHRLVADTLERDWNDKLATLEGGRP
jgi:hypothetical protein